ncbi:MAG: DinB family protein [Anaerolineales bacterium]|nr:DinB family protein [Anaerolineales bacterium]
MNSISQPNAREYPAYAAQYVQRAATRGDILQSLALQPDELRSALEKLSDAQARFKPAPNEWSVKEVVLHITDVERVYSYRLLRISRKDQTPLIGFEQDNYIREAKADETALSDLLDEFAFLRRANALAIRRLDAEALDAVGFVGENSVSARALVYLLVGHAEHHLNSLRESYLPFV